MNQRIIVKLRSAKHSPRKMRVVAEKVKTLSIEKAQEMLKLSTKRAAKLILPLLNSAVANAQNNYGLKLVDLVISEIQVGDARKVRKPIYRARGRMDVGHTRYSHVRLILEARNVVEVQKPVAVTKGGEVKKETKIKKEPTKKTKNVKQ